MISNRQSNIRELHNDQRDTFASAKMTASSNAPSPESSNQTLEKVLEEKILKRVLAEIQESKDDTDSKIESLQLDTDAKINAILRGSQGTNNGDAANNNDPSPADDPPKFKLPRDVYSVLATASWSSVPFWFCGFVIFGFQYFLLILLLANQVDINSEDNPLNLPANVETPVRISQILLVAIALFSQDDLLVGIESFFDGKPDYYRGDLRFVSMPLVQWRLASVIRLVQGLLNLLAAFVLSIQAETIPDVLLNVLGVGFISNLDDLAFGLALKGYFGQSTKSLAKDVCDAEFHRNSKKDQNIDHTLVTKLKNSAHIMMAFAVLVVILFSFTFLSIAQNRGMFSEQDIQIEFGDELLPFLGLFNGCYKASESSNEQPSGRLVYEQVGYANGGKFGFCSDFGGGDGGWAFFIGEVGDICETFIVRSGETSTFSLLEAATTKWYTSEDLPLDYLEITEIKNPSSECGQSMLRKTIDACPAILDFDSIPMSRLPQRIDNMESRSILDASVSHPIYYYNRIEARSFDLLFFTGRRWLRTNSEHISTLAGNETSLSDIHDFFFVKDGLFTLINDLRTSPDSQTLWVSAMSGIVDVKRDQGSALGLQWYLPRYETADETSEGDNSRGYLQRNFPSADLTRPIDTVMTCLYCNKETNPCRYEGVCDNDSGICNCKHGTKGELCQIEPLENGVCDLFFNTAEYQYDGGDCCGGTCVGAQCGEDDRPNPFLDAMHLSNPLFFLGEPFFAFDDMADDWNDTYRGREFGFGMDIVNDDDLKFYFVPFRYEHCIDPNTALLLIQMKPVWYQSDMYKGLEFEGITVRCDGTFYLRMPEFTLNTVGEPTGTFQEQVRVPYGADCVIEFISEHGYMIDEVSVFAENEPEPFIKQRRILGSDTVPTRFQIPESTCVRNLFLENRFSISSFEVGEWNMPDLSFGWNEYMSEDEYTSFAEGGQIDAICKRDRDEVLERYVLWKIANSTIMDLSQNFFGHICDGLWDERDKGSLSLTCSGRRVNTLHVPTFKMEASQIEEAIKMLEYAKKLEHVGLPGIGNETLEAAAMDVLSTLPVLTSLDMTGASQNNLTSLPSKIGSLTSLQGLDLYDNQLTSLPSEIGRLISLTNLNLYSNQLTSLPSEIGRLTSLQDLDLSDNQLISLPSEIGSLTLLTRLDLRQNPLISRDSLPTEILSLDSLYLLLL
ncbi:unnamed protein product [Cylindrotheca closterium]|uniref:EGF-like domain-containing protein n=1 Tax=Cylindrotheca closterium TaxID=2856 RepID=A0AAD2PXX4_9STRA|nr:unnamed protein product [Cylindrotheca closterium]